MTRVHVASGTGTSAANPRQQENTITAWLDGSSVYGSDSFRATWLRSFQGGKLKVWASPNGDMLPCNTIDGDCNSTIDINAPFMAGQDDHCGNRVK